ncbi:DUF1349 domain-containing protein [Flagellimonas allohymeniacidonis]|nr:DUF1349 domain-containing protein [Allomuricauda hymeniacidonis]
MNVSKRIVPILVFTIFSCNTKDYKAPAETSEMKQLMEPNFKPENLATFKWMNTPKSFEIVNGTLKVVAGKGTDFFNNPEDNSITSSAPFLFQEVQGDFVTKALVRPDFSSLWNAIALMVHIDNNNWIKFAFENSDATGKSIVTVVTKNVSDDANGVILHNQDEVWLKLIRKGNIYSMLWSIDGKNFKMARLSTLPQADSIKIGIEVQSPVGESATHEIDFFDITKTTVKDLRKGE